MYPPLRGSHHARTRIVPFWTGDKKDSMTEDEWAFEIAELCAGDAEFAAVVLTFLRLVAEFYASRDATLEVA